MPIECPVRVRSAEAEAILHNSSYNYAIGGARKYYNYYYVTLLWVGFMADFLFLALAQLFVIVRHEQMQSVVFDLATKNMT